VKAVDLAHAIERAFLDHHPCPAAPRAFLRGLEQQTNVARQLIPRGGERRGDPQHDRRVTVVAALVRDSIVHGSIRQIRGLVNRQGVEITPQGDRGCVSFVKIREDSGLGTDPRRVAQLAQPSHHHFLRPAFLETEFGVLVDIVPNLPKLGE
jgi:hypothetical protein